MQHDGRVEPGGEALREVRVRARLEGGGAHERDVLKLVLHAAEAVVPEENLCRFDYVVMCPMLVIMLTSCSVNLSISVSISMLDFQS